MKLIETPIHTVYDFMHQRMILFVLYRLFHKFHANVAFPQFTRIFYQIGNIASIVWLSYQNLKYRVISCEPKKKISLRGGYESWGTTRDKLLASRTSKRSLWFRFQIRTWEWIPSLWRPWEKRRRRCCWVPALVRSLSRSLGFIRPPPALARNSPRALCLTILPLALAPPLEMPPTPLPWLKTHLAPQLQVNPIQNIILWWIVLHITVHD